jgi:hypothetical protein
MNTTLSAVGILGLLSITSAIAACAAERAPKSCRAARTSLVHRDGRPDLLHVEVHVAADAK